jgi:hypothetical protein
MPRIETGSGIPMPFIKRVSLESTRGNEQTTATVDIALKKSSNDEWGGIKKSLKMHLVHVTDRTIFNDYISPQSRGKLIKTLAKSKKIKNHSLQTAEIHSIDISRLPSDTYYNKKTKTRDSLYTQACHIKKKDPNFLGVIAIVCQDMKPKLSKVSAEIVIDNGKLVTEAKVYAHSARPNSSWPRAAVDNISAQELTVINTTIQDFRDVERVKNLRIDETVVQNSIFNSPNDGISPINKKKPKNAYFSDINLTFDTQGNCRCMSSVNWADMIKDHSQFPRLISTEGANGNVSLDYEKFNFQKILSLSRIKSFVVKRRKVHYLNKYKNQHLMNSLNSNASMKSYEDNKEEIIASSNDNGHTLTSKFFAKTESSTKGEKVSKPVGHIKEIKDLFIRQTTNNKRQVTPSSQFRHFTWIDYSMKENNDGEYHYSVEIEIEDGTRKYLTDMTNRLKMALRGLERYNNHTILSAQNPRLKFRAVSNNFVNLHDLKTAAFAGSPWKTAAAVLTEVAKTFNSPVEYAPSSDLQQNLHLMSSPYTGSLKGISMLIDAVRITIGKLESMLKVNRGTQNLGSDSSPKSPGLGNRFSLNTFKIKHDFEETINAREFTDAGYDYLGEARLHGVKGLQGMSLKNLESRTREETLKYFSPNQTDTNKIMTGTEFEDSTSITEISYLTPKNVHLPSNNYSMYFVKNNKVKALADKNTIKALIDIISYKNFGHVPEVDVAPEESGKFTKDIDENDARSPASMKIASKVLDLLSLSNCTIEAYNPRERGLTEEEIEKSDILGSSLTKRSNLEAERALENTATTAKNNIPLNVNSLAIPITYMKYANILGENSRLKSFDTTSPSFKHEKSVKRKTLPNHFKSLIAASTGDIAVNRNWFSEKNTLEKIAFFILHHKTLATIEVLSDFKGGNLRQPNWRTLDRSIINDVSRSEKRNLLCRIIPYSDSAQNSPNSGQIKLESVDLPIYNQYFLLNIVDSRQIKPKPVTVDNSIKSMSNSLESDTFVKMDNEFMYTTSIEPISPASGVTIPAPTEGATPSRRRRSRARNVRATTDQQQRTASPRAPRGTTTMGSY